MLVRKQTLPNLKNEKLTDNNHTCNACLYAFNGDLLGRETYPKKAVIYVSFRPFPDDCRCQVDEEEAAKALA